MYTIHGSLSQLQPFKYLHLELEKWRHHMKTHCFQIKDYKSTNLQGVVKNTTVSERPKVGNIVFTLVLIQTLYNKVAAFKGHHRTSSLLFLDFLSDPRKLLAQSCFHLPQCDCWELKFQLPNHRMWMTADHSALMDYEDNQCWKQA